MNLRILIAIILFNTNVSYSQNDSANLENTFWINDSKETLALNSRNHLNSSCRNSKETILSDQGLEIINDTLILYSILREFAKEVLKEELRFKIITSKTDKLVLIPISKKAILFFDNKNTIEFEKHLDIEKIDELNLEEIRIERSGYDLIITKDLQVQLTLDEPIDVPLKHINEEEAKKYGNYIGKIEMEEYQELKYSLIRVGLLRNEQFGNFNHSSHARITTLSLKYNEGTYKHVYDSCKLTLEPFQQTISKLIRLERLEKVTTGNNR